MTDYRVQADPRKNLVGISVVVLLHLGVAYALATGLASKVVEVIRSPIETRIIEEPPPPPKEETPPPPPPVVKAPPPPFVPPPEVAVTPPPDPPPAIEVATPEPPPEPVFEPTPPVVEAPPPPRPAPVNIAVACPTRAVPRLGARQEGVEGQVRARLTIRGGKVVAVDILNSTPKGVFDAVVRAAVLQYGCQSTGDQVLVAEQTFRFTAD